MSTLCLIGFAAFAALDWYAVGVKWKEGEYIAKPATLAMLLLYAATNPAASWVLLAALMFSLLGDVYLMLPVDLFIAGLSAFLVGHVAYVFAIDADTTARLLWLAVFVVASSPVVFKILSAAPSAMRGPVAVYMLAIGSMVGSAIAAGNPYAIAGALLFAASDSMIGWDRFVAPFAGARLAIIVTYHLGQLGLVWGLTQTH